MRRSNPLQSSNSSTLKGTLKGGLGNIVIGFVVVSVLVVVANLSIGFSSSPRFSLPSRFVTEDVSFSLTKRNTRSSKSESSVSSSSLSGRRSASSSASGSVPIRSKYAIRHEAAFDLMFPTSDTESLVTQEACVAQSDESETCFYKGPLCYDGGEAVVSVRGVKNNKRGHDMRNSNCYDFRNFVNSQTCHYGGPHKRDNLPKDSPKSFLQDDAPRFTLGAAEHKWGPMGREVSIREVDEDVFKTPAKYNVSIQWIGEENSMEGLYIGGLHGSWLDHTWHFAAAMMSLFDLKRHNRTEPLDSQQVSDILVAAPAWAAPSIRYLLIAGEYRHVSGLHELKTWIANLLSMLVQNSTKVLWNTDWEQVVVPERNRWICSKKGTILGLKPRFFNSIGDAHAFRLMSYAFAGVTERAKDEWPPRQITLITRIGTRALENIDDVVPILNSTGLTFRWIQEMGALSWREQVEAMAQTGILLAIHGAGLTNVLFMPAHAVVIEIFPYVMYASMYRDLAATSGLYYYRIQSVKPPNNSGAANLLYEDSFMKKCDGINTENGLEHHISSPAAFLDHECNWRSKSSPLVVDPDQLRLTIAMALDDIGCRDSFCEFGYNQRKMN